MVKCHRLHSSTPLHMAAKGGHVEVVRLVHSGREGGSVIVYWWEVHGVNILFGDHLTLCYIYVHVCMHI